jgi:hypothetical protein
MRTVVEPPTAGASLVARTRDRLVYGHPALGAWLSEQVDGIWLRRRRPWLAALAVPLAMNATMLLTLWWTWFPLGLCAWWWSDRAPLHAWLFSLQRGTVGTGWCVAGTSALQYWSGSMLIVGAAWVAAASTLAALGYLVRSYETAIWGVSSGY